MALLQAPNSIIVPFSICISHSCQITLQFVPQMTPLFPTPTVKDFGKLFILADTPTAACNNCINPFYHRRTHASSCPETSLYHFLSPGKSADLTKECPPPGMLTCFRHPVETSSAFSPAGPDVLQSHGSSHADQGTGSVTDQHLLMTTAIKLCNAGSLTAVHSPGAENDARREERDL